MRWLSFLLHTAADYIRLRIVRSYKKCFILSLIISFFVLNLIALSDAVLWIFSFVMALFINTSLQRLLIQCCDSLKVYTKKRYIDIIGRKYRIIESENESSAIEK